jgi:osmotically-inducible protein OsmY
MRQLLIAGVALGLLAFAGCTPQQEAKVQDGVQNARQGAEEAARNTQQAVRNAALEGKVKTALETRKGLKGAKIDVEARGSSVTLKGDVQSTEQAELAERVARETEGVETVENRLTMRIPAKPQAAAPSTVAPESPAPQSGY